MTNEQKQEGMTPILLKGHEGPISKLKYNRQGDLLFTCARKDKKPCVWFADNGERLGNFIGHEGACWDIDVDFASKRCLTASADRTARLWDVQTGTELFQFPHASSVRCVGFAEGDTLMLTVQEDNFSSAASIFVYNLEADIKEQTWNPVREMNGDTGKINAALWGPLNHHIFTGSVDGTIRKWNVEQSKEEQKVQAHAKEIRSMQFSKDRTMFITASIDKTAKLWDTKTMECLKTFKSDRPLNSASISPLFNQVIVGGGQDAMNVTVTSSKVGHFEVDFYHMVYMDYMGSVKGHFGPVNSLSFNPDGRSYASGSEDGYVRLHHFDKNYFTNKHNGL
jgi:translation initiation factor 3 subunit I